MNIEVVVQLKKEVLDPEGRAICETLGRLGYRTLKGVTVSKRYVLEFEDHDGKGEEHAARIAGEYLANPVSETYLIKKL